MSLLSLSLSLSYCWAGMSRFSIYPLSSPRVCVMCGLFLCPLPSSLLSLCWNSMHIPYSIMDRILFCISPSIVSRLFLIDLRRGNLCLDRFVRLSSLDGQGRQRHPRHFLENRQTRRSSISTPFCSMRTRHFCMGPGSTKTGRMFDMWHGMW